MTNGLLIIAHPDDETIFLGGTLLTLSHITWQIVCVTYQLPELRAAELVDAVNAYRACGVDIILRFLGHPDRGVQQAQIDQSLLLRQLAGIEGRFDLVITHNAQGEYGHDAHRAVHICTHQIFPAAWNIVYDNSLDSTKQPESGMRSGEVLDVALEPGVIAAKAAVFRECYPSQQSLWQQFSVLPGWAFSKNVETVRR